ncbi:MAG: molybdate ABC transporter substrate-binding protein [Verrucomicrobiota bacterium]
MINYLSAILLVSVTILGGFPLVAATVTVFAAASLTDSLKEIAAAYEKPSGDKIVFNFAASGPLARQIEAGAPADLFFSADEAKMDTLEKQGLIVKETRRSRLSNLLVLVTLTDSSLTIASPRDLATPGVKRLALGDPKTVPAGTYAKEYLTKLELWSGVEKKIIPCESVRAVLAAVESGNVDAGMVYKTDAAISGKVKVAFKVSANDGPKISYPLALVKDSRQPVAARKFLDHLTGPEADKVFLRRGFILLPAEAKQ